MVRRLALVAVTLLALSICGCKSRDTRAFENAKSQNTEQAYETYISGNPDGQHMGEAKQMAEQCAFDTAAAQGTLEAYTEYLSKYESGEHTREVQRAIVSQLVSRAKKLWDEALALEDKREWEGAKAKYDAAISTLDLKPYGITPDKSIEDVLKLLEEARSTCQYGVNHPLEIFDDEALMQYSYTDHGLHYSYIKITGKVVNNTAKPVKSVIFNIGLSGEKALTIDLETHEDKSRGGSTSLGSAKKAVYFGKSLQPGEERAITLSTPLSVDLPLLQATGDTNMSFLNPDPETTDYSVEVDSYETDDQ